MHEHVEAPIAPAAPDIESREFPPRQIARSCGILLHPTSLPGRYGIGDFGPAAFGFAEQLARGKQTWWQMLPLGPGDCPYQSFSAMAGNPLLISPDVLFEEGLLGSMDINLAPAGPIREHLASGERVDFAACRAMKESLLRRAWERFQAGAVRGMREQFDQFRDSEAGWLDDFSLFMALKSAHAGKAWADWPGPIVRRNAAALREARHSLAGDISRRQFEQFIFFRQFDALRAHAGKLGVRFIGDLPIFVSGESADVWANSHLFQLDKDRRPKVVAGVPPDYFSTTGQRWGNPLFNWKAMERDGFRWWIARARAALRQADLVRIDHFRGFSACWTIPASEPTAEKGHWAKAPGRELFIALGNALGGLPFIAEDLGVITADVEALRDGLALPGMRVLQFAFGGGADSPFLPHNYIHNSIIYTGTHDNDTTVGWEKSLDRKTRAHFRRYAPQASRDPAWGLIRLAWASVSDIAIAPLQDVLRLGSEARMNTPGTGEGNWSWRVSPDLLKSARFDRLRKLTETYGRAAGKVSKPTPIPEAPHCG